MSRQANDGRGRLGGRAKGTPNASNPLKAILRQHSIAYFEPKDNGDVSDFEADVALMSPTDRANIHEKILQYHSPKMQSVSADVSVSADTRSLSDLLTSLASLPK